jgi:hypothetical protein
LAFVNVLGGNEIYNFRIHRLVHFYSRIWSFWCSNRDSANKLVSATFRAATSRRDAAPRPRPRTAPSAFALVHRPRRPSLEVDRRPRPCFSRGRPRPATRRSPRSSHTPARHARCADQTHTLDPAGRPRLPALVRRTMAETSRCRHRWLGRPLFKHSPFLLAPPNPAPAAPPHPPLPVAGELSSP